MFTQIIRSAICGIVALLMFLGGLWLFQRESLIIKNQDAIIQAVSQHDRVISQVVQFLNSQQKPQAAAPASEN